MTAAFLQDLPILKILLQAGTEIAQALLAAGLMFTLPIIGRNRSGYGPRSGLGSGNVELLKNADPLVDPESIKMGPKILGLEILTLTPGVELLSGTR